MTKHCSVCLSVKSITEFHLNKYGKFGRSSQCASCFNAHRLLRRRRVSRLWVEKKSAEQDGKCEICGNTMIKACVDHCHRTMNIRGLLCVSCNLKLGIIEDDTFIANAHRYLKKYGSM